MKVKSETLVSALRLLSESIESQDGIAGECLRESAGRIEELEAEITVLKDYANRQFEAILKPSVN